MPCDDLEVWDGGRGEEGGRLKRGGTYVYLRLILLVVQQKPAYIVK